MKAAIKLTLFTIFATSLLTLLMTVPKMVSEREAIRMSMDMLVGQSKIKGMITEGDYEGFVRDLADEGLDDNVDRVVTSSGIGERVQKADMIRVRTEYHYDVLVPFTGIRRIDAPPVQVESVSHRYWK